MLTIVLISIISSFKEIILLAILGILTICGFGYIVVTILSVIGPVILIYLGVKGLIHLFKK